MENIFGVAVLLCQLLEPLGGLLVVAKQKVVTEFDVSYVPHSVRLPFPTLCVAYLANDLWLLEQHVGSCAKDLFLVLDLPKLKLLEYESYA